MGSNRSSHKTTDRESTMSTSFVYHAFGLHDYDYVSQKFERGKIIIKIRPK